MKITTDLALEARDLASANQGEIPGVVSDTKEKNGVVVHTIDIVSKEGEKAIGKPQGRYVTLELPRFYSHTTETFDTCVSCLQEAIKDMMPQKDKHRVLIVGLGNEGITPDALGPVTIKSVIVTRHIEHLHAETFEELNLESVAAIAAGVMGTTGIETAEIVDGLVKKVEPTCVIAVDALAARSLSRLATTVQITNTGVSPGSGVGNSRAEFSEKRFGVPVISIGMPTVVNGATLTADVASMVSDEDRSTLYEKAKKALEPYDMDIYVTPKDIDSIIVDASKLIAYALNLAIHNITKNEMMELI